MEISKFFMNGDIKGAIAYMREHEEFKDILPAYTAIFENCEYRSYDRTRSMTFCVCIRFIFATSFIAACLSLRPRTSC